MFLFSHPHFQLLIARMIRGIITSIHRKRKWEIEHRLRKYLPEFLEIYGPWLARQNSRKENKLKILFLSVKLNMTLFLFPFQKWTNTPFYRPHSSCLIILPNSFEPKLFLQTSSLQYSPCTTATKWADNTKDRSRKGFPSF